MRILVLGASGQDGSIIAEKYTKGGHQVIGVNSSPKTTGSIGIEMLDFDFTNLNESTSLLQAFRPDRIFHLATVHSSSALVEIPVERTRSAIFQCNVEITRNILDWQRLESNCKSVFALSSQMYSSQKSGRVIDETSKFAPQNYYAETKIQALSLIRKYRQKYKTQSFGAILFNHTSTRSKAEFLFPQLVIQIKEILAGKSSTITLQDPDLELDICHASEISYALMELIELCEPTDFVLARGECIKIRDLITNVFGRLSFDGHFEIKKSGKSIGNLGLIGDSSKAFRTFGWKANLTPEDILLEMIGVLDT
jgi:GDPmannose 4,6-dehydratase